MRRWSHFPTDNSDRAVRRWLCELLGSSGLAMAEDARECAGITDRLMAGLDDRSRILLEAVDRRYDEAELNWIGAGLDRLLAGEPVQYVVGWTEFRGLRIACGPEALIPRPETEEVVSWFLEGLDGISSAVDAPITVVDVGTGTGCMALSIKAARPHWRVMGLDVSPGALDMARRNAETLGLEVEWLAADFLTLGSDGWPQRVHGIVSNPPYIPRGEAASMDDHVALMEPDLALFVPDDDPLCFYRGLLEAARNCLNPVGCMVAECHREFTREVADCWQLEGAQSEVLSDLQGAERAVRIVRS